MSKIHASLKSASEDKAFEGIGKSVPTFALDPLIIQIEPGFNARPIYPAHVAYLKELRKAGVDTGFLVVQMVDGVPFVRDGHHRLTDALECIAEGMDIKTVKCIEFKGDEIAATYMMLGTQSGLQYTPLELGVKYAELVNVRGQSFAEIAKKRGMSIQHVKDCIRLTEQPVEMKELISSGTIAPATALKLIKKEGVKAATATIREGIVVANGKPITQKVIDNLAKNVVSDAAKRTTTAKEHISAMLDSPAFDAATKGHLGDTLKVLNGQRITVPDIGKWLADLKDHKHTDIKHAAHLLFDVLNKKPIPDDNSPGAQAYGHMVWLQDMAAGSKEPTFRAAAHWFMAVLDAKRAKRDLAPAPSVLSFEEALRAEMESGGNVLAETLCPEHADLIKQVRGRA